MSTRPNFLRQINGGERIDTSRICCDSRCFQRNPSQGGSCPLDRHDPAPADPERTMNFIYWMAGVALLSALVFALIAPVQAGELLGSFLGIPG